jgi:hypothetical protein
MASRRARKCLTTCLLLALSAAAGCHSEPETGQVSGLVRYDRQLLNSGNVTFRAADGTEACATISEKGEYRIPRIPVGLVRIGVESFPRVPEGLQKPGGADPKAPLAVSPGKHVAIPALYKHPQESGLTYTVQKGTQTYNIDLPALPSPER